MNWESNNNNNNNTTTTTIKQQQLRKEWIESPIYLVKSYFSHSMSISIDIFIRSRLSDKTNKEKKILDRNCAT